MAGTRIVWHGNLIEGILSLNERIGARLAALTHYAAQDMESWAKTNARWTDRTGNARNGLKATPHIIPLKSYAVTLSHGVPYGIWLEIANGGKYAIIMDTIHQEEPKIMAMVREVLGGI